jgi:ribosomal protein S18 acetylase RimI-like enzyme
MNFEIRLAEKDDWEQITQFNLQLAEETENKNLDWETLSCGVQSVLSDVKKGRYFVACLENKIIGQLMHTWEWSDWRNGELWWLQSVYVDAQYRQRGVFRKLYQVILNDAKTKKNVVGIRLYVENENLRAQKTYEKLGMNQSGYQVLEELF